MLDARLHPINTIKPRKKPVNHPFKEILKVFSYKWSDSLKHIPPKNIRMHHKRH